MRYLSTSIHMKHASLLAFLAAIIAPILGLADTVYEPVAALEKGPTHPDRAQLLAHSDGNFYGTTPSGGAYSAGDIFRVTPAGVVSVVVHFTGTNGVAFGSQPFAVW